MYHHHMDNELTFTDFNTSIKPIEVHGSLHFHLDLNKDAN